MTDTYEQLLEARIKFMGTGWGATSALEWALEEYRKLKKDEA